VYNTHLYEEPGRDERQAAVLPVKSIVVRVEGEVIQVEKSETEAKTRHQMPWNNLVEQSVGGVDDARGDEQIQGKSLRSDDRDRRARKIAECSDAIIPIRGVRR